MAEILRFTANESLPAVLAKRRCGAGRDLVEYRRKERLEEIGVP